jgi:hypothetical protein
LLLLYPPSPYSSPPHTHFFSFDLERDVLVMLLLVRESDTNSQIKWTTIKWHMMR